MIPPPQFLCGAGKSLCGNLPGRNWYGIIRHRGGERVELVCLYAALWGRIAVYRVHQRPGGQTGGPSERQGGQIHPQPFWVERPARAAALGGEAAVKRLSRAQKLMLLTDQTLGMPPSGPRGDPEGGSGAE